MLCVSSDKKYAFVLLVHFFVSSFLFNGILGLQNQQQTQAVKLAVISHGICQSCPAHVSSLKDIDTYSELKNDPQASLPSSFTICVSVLVTSDDQNPSLFTLLGNDERPWFSPMIQQFDFVGKQFYYATPNQNVKFDTMRMFPNQWVRSCLALDTLSGLVQWVARGELVDNSTLAGITNNVPTDLSGKLILGSVYFTFRVKWQLSRNKLTKLEIFSSTLSVEKMTEYTKGEGCGDEGDYLAWNKMQWNFHGEGEIEHMEAEESCTMQPFNFYFLNADDAGAFDWKSCMDFCQNLGGSRVPPMTSLPQWERVRSYASKKEIDVGFENLFWVPIHDEEKEGEWRDFYNHQVLNFTTSWANKEPNGEKSENCAVTLNGAWYDADCNSKGSCLCQRQPYMQLRGLCANSAIDKYYQPMHYAAISM